MSPFLEVLKLFSCCYIVRWFLSLCNSFTASKIVIEMTTDHWFEMFEKNDDKWHIRNIQIKYTIIIIVQYTIAEYLPFFVQS